MENAFYERHSYKIYKGKQLPFICHSDYLPADSMITRVHWHENPEFLRCKEGGGETLCAAERYDFDPGDIFVINPNEPHNFNSKSQEGVNYDCLIVDAMFCKENGIDIEKLRFETKICDSVACEYYDKAFKACMEDTEFQSLTARTYVLQFLLYMCQKHLISSQNKISVTGMEEIKKSVTYIRNNYMNSITLQEAADVAGFSVYYFSREFKKVTGLTFVTFLNMVRCENAAKRLRKGANVTDVCFSCGFKELSYFSRTFSKIMGVTPSSLHKTE